MSKAARIRAARQRRYGKKTAGIPSTSEEVESKDEPEPTAAETLTKTNMSDQLAADDDSADVIEKSTKLTETTTEIPQEEDKSPVTSVEHSGEEPKKKYMGVARMRRNLIKKKKQEGEAESTERTPSTTESSAKISVEATCLPPDTLKVRALPVYMHVITISLLFFAGMDVSMQKYNQPVLVYSKFAFHEHGLPLISRPLKSSAVRKESVPEVPLPHENMGSNPAEMVDEFKDEDSPPTKQNIDPLFRVDLDELTKGPGIINQLARGAVAAHRAMLWFVYYLPLGILQSLLSIPKAMLRSPPALCVLALSLRHLVGKGILGAGIPEPVNAGDRGNTIDVIAMAKNFVTSFLTTNFPMAVGLYDGFTHLRGDMYVLLCGVFSGLVWAHWRASIPLPEPQAEMQLNDEL